MVLVNHHLFFADLALRAALARARSVLPRYEAVIFDEAHQLEEVATEFFGLHVSSQRLYALARDGGKSGRPGAHHRAGDLRAGACRAATDALGLSPARRAAGAAAPVRTRSAAAPTILGLRPDCSPLARTTQLDTVLEEAKSCSRALRSRPGDEAGGRATPCTPAAASRAVGLGAGRGRCAPTSALIDGRQPRSVRWIAASPPEFQPARVAGRRRRLARRGASTRTRGPSCSRRRPSRPPATFSYIPRAPRPRRHRGRGGGSPPPSATRSRRALPAAELPDPNSRGFAAAAAERLLELCTASRGARCCCSRAFATCDRRGLLPRGQRFPLLVQGEPPAHALLEELRHGSARCCSRRRASGKASTCRARRCRWWSIDCLPFAVPNDPLTAARLDQIRESGGHTVLGSYQLPQAALALGRASGG